VIGAGPSCNAASQSGGARRRDARTGKGVISVAAEGTEYFEREYFVRHPGKVRYLAALIGLLRKSDVLSGKVLDIGAGYGFFLAELKRAGFDPYGLEVSAHAAAKAREAVDARVVCQSADAHFPFNDDVFSAITCFDVIEHVADFPAMLRESFRTLQPGGKLFVITLSAHSIARFLLGRHWSWYQDRTHLHLFAPRATARVLERVGFVNSTVTTFFNFCSVGETTEWLKPLRRIDSLFFVPFLGDSLLAIAEKPARLPGVEPPR
jgi:SAM-dependent methyltransferase